MTMQPLLRYWTYDTKTKAF